MIKLCKKPVTYLLKIWKLEAFRISKILNKLTYVLFKENEVRIYSLIAEQLVLEKFFKV